MILLVKLRNIKTKTFYFRICLDWLDYFLFKQEFATYVNNCPCLIHWSRYFKNTRSFLWFLFSINLTVWLQSILGSESIVIFNKRTNEETRNTLFTECHRFHLNINNVCQIQNDFFVLDKSNLISVSMTLCLFRRISITVEPILFSFTV